MDTSVAPTAQSYDEYGNPEDSTTATRYGRLGGKERSSDTVTGATPTGVRLYDPTTGRFLQTDPVPEGSANAYDYGNAEPLDHYDLDGRRWGHRDRLHPMPRAGALAPACASPSGTRCPRGAAASAPGRLPALPGHPAVRPAWTPSPRAAAPRRPAAVLRRMRPPRP
ncbi:RHS repeat-associated core domain-containing protein [Streptomyces sp. NPDC051642]|uniref:RHS repeat-associated core domain-containing protein n=1 Tax=Streptomyces sp. NPDC051642 TaxID=3154646 RepID=UPI0034439598